MEVENTNDTVVSSTDDNRNFASNLSEGGAKESPKEEVKNFAEKFTNPQGQETAAKQESKPLVSGEESKQVPAVEIPAYTPNYKFKVMDKEHEFDEFLRGTIKDAESEKKIRDLYEKAYGLDYAKPKHMKALEENKKYSLELNEYKKSVEEMQYYYGNKDFDNLFKRMEIPEEEVVQWLLDKVKYEQLQPEQKAMIDSRKGQAQQLWQAQQRAAMLEQQNEHYTIQERVNEMRSIMSQPEVKAFAEKFDSLPGSKPGAFWEEVCDRGELAHARFKQDIPPQQAIQEVMAKYAHLSQMQAPQQQAAQQAPQNFASAPRKDVPTIPAINGQSGASPARARPKSLDDIRKIRDNLNR